MISMHTFLLGLLFVSVFTSLTTEAVKKILAERDKKYYSNTLVGIIAIIISIAVGVSYILVTGLTFTTSNIICLVALVFLGWLCAMVGYDKVIQAISQFKTTRED